MENLFNVKRKIAKLTPNELIIIIAYIYFLVVNAYIEH